MFAIAKLVRKQWHYLTYSGRFSPIANSDVWAMDSTTARKVQSRHRDCEIVLIMANHSRPARQHARAGIVDLSALALLAGCSAMAYAIFATVSSFGQFLQF